MKYLLAIAVFLAGAIFPFALKAQSIQFTSGSSTTAAWIGRDSFHHGGFIRPFYGSSGAVVFPPFFGYPSNYPFAYFYPGLWPPLSYEYQQASRIAHGDEAAEVAAQEKAYLSSRVQALTDEVRSLRQQQASRQYAQPPAARPHAKLPQQPSPRLQSGAQQTFPATVFIYRDGHQLEARNYAIYGKTLWVFQGETTRKIPLADLNLSASRKLNEEHGVEFPLSEP